MDTLQETKPTPRSATRPAAGRPLLGDATLEAFWQRAPGYDRENSFFTEDFADLRDAGYLTAAVPAELGGRGLSLAQVCAEQRRVAYYAPATALAVNMHLYWTGVAADLWRAGDRSLEWLLREAVAGRIFAAGHAESGNDIPVLLSTTKAEPVDGGYRFTGRKSFGSLVQAWDYLGLHGLDTTDPSAPKVVHAFAPRDSDGMSYRDTWDALGMRATRSDDTVLDGVFVKEEHIARVVPAGGAGVDAFVLGIFAWALLPFGNIYYGLAQRVFDMAVESAKSKQSLAVSRSMAYHPEIQHAIADMALHLAPIAPHLDSVAADWSNGVNHGATWPAKIFAAKHHAVDASWSAVDLALDVVGGFGIFRKAGFERLFRDARLGRIHPSNPFLTREVVAKTALGIGLDEQPRWG
jgi:alkylation response protein AidB-like acyl-CoA dehydrogenase